MYAAGCVWSEIFLKYFSSRIFQKKYFAQKMTDNYIFPSLHFGDDGYNVSMLGTMDDVKHFWF
jgi:hypothetical protein